VPALSASSRDRPGFKRTTMESLIASSGACLLASPAEYHESNFRPVSALT
jgi:hypothetical protein